MRQTDSRFTKPSLRTQQTPHRWACVSAPVTCRRCHHHWAGGDPAYSLACRGCGAPAGAPCCRPEGGNERVCHQRDRDARTTGLLIACEGLSWDGRHDKPLPLSMIRRPDAAAVLTGSLVPRPLAA